MVTLTETTEIAAPFEKLEWWVDHFEEEFVKWSPLHLECELLSGGIQAGDKVRFHEIVMGMDYDVTGTIILRFSRVPNLLNGVNACRGWLLLVFLKARIFASMRYVRFRQFENCGL